MQERTPRTGTHKQVDHQTAQAGMVQEALKRPGVAEAIAVYGEITKHVTYSLHRVEAKSEYATGGNP